MLIDLPRVCNRVRLVPGLLALFHFAAPVDLGSRPIRGASGRVVEVIAWHGQSPCKASSRNVMVSASQKSGDRPRRIIMSSFGSSSDFWPLGNANGFRVVKPRAGSGSSRRANAAAHAVRRLVYHLPPGLEPKNGSNP